MQTTNETILIPMKSGDLVPHDVLSFDCAGHRLSVRRVNSGLCLIVHRATGLGIIDQWTGDSKEAAEGFFDGVEVGLYNLSGVAKAAAQAKQINA